MGGGVSGLATAYWLAVEHGVDVVVLEAGDRLGGKVSTQDRGRDAGRHRARRVPQPGPRPGRARRPPRPGRRGGGARCAGRSLHLVAWPDAPDPAVRGVRHPRPDAADAALAPAVAGRHRCAPASTSFAPAPRSRRRPDRGGGRCVPVSAARWSSAWCSRCSAACTPARSTGSVPAAPSPTCSRSRARSARSMLALRHRRRGTPAPTTPPAPPLVSLRGGLGWLVGALVDAVGARPPGHRRTGHGPAPRPPTGGGSRPPPSTSSRDRSCWPLPPTRSPSWWRRARPSWPHELRGIEYVDVATVTLALPQDEVGELTGTGFLVPPVEGAMLVGCTWLTSKWPHLAGGDHRAAALHGRSRR